MSKYSVLSAAFLILTSFSTSVFTCNAFAGIYSGPTDTNHSNDPAIASNDARFVQWANAIDASRTSFAPRGSSAINQTGGFNSLGDLDTTEIANGDSAGFLTVLFPTGIANGAGADFAVFESGFAFGTTPDGGSGLFAEFAYVDVSTNGTDFVRFPSISANTGPLPGGFGSAFSGFDVTNVHNLAGKHAAGFGTPFDLSDLSSETLVTGGLVDLNNIQFVRLFDIPGDGSFLDSQGNGIVDNWLTTGSGGYDFQLGTGTGVGVINAIAVPEPSGMAMLGLAALIATRRRTRRHARHHDSSNAATFGDVS